MPYVQSTHVFVVAVKITEEVDVQADVFYPITCGDAKATLIWKKFVCPGINVKCVQVYTNTRKLESFHLFPFCFSELPCYCTLQPCDKVEITLGSLE